MYSIYLIFDLITSEITLKFESEWAESLIQTQICEELF